MPKTLKQHKRALRMARLWAKIGDELGEAAERYFEEMILEAQAQLKLPLWFKGYIHYARHSPEERLGVDFLIQTDCGDIKINIKSSNIGVLKFQIAHPTTDIIPFKIDILEKNKKKVCSWFISVIGARYREMREAAKTSIQSAA